MNKPRDVGLSSQAHVLSISSFPHPFSKWECLHLKLSSENSPEARDLTACSASAGLQPPTGSTAQFADSSLLFSIPLCYAAFAFLLFHASPDSDNFPRSSAQLSLSPNTCYSCFPFVRTATIPAISYTCSQRGIPLTAKPGIPCSPAAQLRVRSCFLLFYIHILSVAEFCNV